MKIFKRVISFILSVVLSLSFGATVCFADNAVDNAAFYTAITTLQQKYRHGEYWNRLSNYDGTTTQNACDHERSCNHNPVADCGTYIYNGTVKAWQCHGFACQMGYLIFGSDPYGWEKHTDTAQLKPGDIVYGYLTSWGHSIFITDVSGDTITYADCNYDGACKVAWGKTTTRATLQTAIDNSHKNSMFGYISHAPNNAATGGGIPVRYESSGGEGTLSPSVFFRNEPFTLAKNTFTFDGYRLLGWQLKNTAGEWMTEDAGWCSEDLLSDNCEKKLYLDEEVIEPNAAWYGAEELIFCAVWEPHEHLFENYLYNEDATFDADGTMTGSCSCGAMDTVTAPDTMLPLLDSSALFLDIPTDAWYREYTDYTVSYRILNGSGDTMNPESNITRAEFVQVLANLSGVDTSNKQVNAGFNDVKSGDWYAPAVKWASENGIAGGMGDGQFAPTASITREQMCTMLVRYIENYLHKDLQKTVSKKPFADDAKISSWAKDYVYDCQQAGLVNGISATEFAPGQSANRASIAALMTRFHQSYVR